MVTLMRVDQLVVRVGIEPVQGFRIKRGDPVLLQPVTSGGAPVSGTLIRVEGLLSPKTHLIDADVAMSARLLPGAAFEAQITVGHFEGFVVPREAVLRDAKGAYVFQIGDYKAHRVDVTIAGSAGDQTAVNGPIEPEKRIVLQGNYQLENGMNVRLSDMEMPAAGPASPVEQ
jgi:membrane fusion protein, multidrug efflux system